MGQQRGGLLPRAPHDGRVRPARVLTATDYRIRAGFDHGLSGASTSAVATDTGSAPASIRSQPLAQ